MLLVDTNVLIDVLVNDPQWANWSVNQLLKHSRIQPLAINQIIYSELSTTFASIDDLDRTVNDLELIMLEIPKLALFLAGKAYVQYRRQGGKKQNVLPDFFIGAQASVLNCTILTRDKSRYSTYFPKVTLITP